MVKRDLDIIIINAVNTPPWLRDFKSRFYILERAFGANNVIFERNAVNTPPPSLTDLNFLVGGVFTANTTVL